MVNSTQAPEKRESALKGKVQSVTNAKFPVYCSNRGSAGPSEEVTTPTTECEVELLKGGRIVSNELKTKGSVREDIGDEERRAGERETFTKAPGTGLVKETIPAGAQKVDVRAPRESWGRGQRPSTCTAGPTARERHQGEHSSQGGRAQGPKIRVADLVGPTPKEKRQRTPQACTASRAN